MGDSGPIDTDTAPEIDTQGTGFIPDTFVGGSVDTAPGPDTFDTDILIDTGS